MVSPFINECAIKINAFILIFFIFFHFILKYGKCGIINIERFFLKENFKDKYLIDLFKNTKNKYYLYIKYINNYQDTKWYNYFNKVTKIQNNESSFKNVKIIKYVFDNEIINFSYFNTIYYLH